MPWIPELLLAPFETAFFGRALVGGVLAAAICAIAGTWVVARGMAFLGEALGHGMLPGVAVATLLGGSPLAGAAVSAALMAVGIGWLTRRARLRDDTAIGIAFVGMLALGVVFVSHSASFATDATAILFGDVLAIQHGDLLALGIGLAATAALALALHRPILALAFDERIAATLGLRPGLARIGLVALVTIAVVASYQAVGTLLVVALLVAPPAAAAVWSRSILGTMAGGAGVGALAVAVGLIASWHLGTAAGASIAIVAVLAFAASSALRALLDLRSRDGARPAHATTPTTGAPVRVAERSAA